MNYVIKGPIQIKNIMRIFYDKLKVYLKTLFFYPLLLFLVFWVSVFRFQLIDQLNINCLATELRVYGFFDSQVALFCSCIYMEREPSKPRNWWKLFAISTWVVMTLLITLLLHLHSSKRGTPSSSSNTNLSWLSVPLWVLPALVHSSWFFSPCICREFS